MSAGPSNGQLQVDSGLKQEAGVPVHKFDPDASPEEKAAQAGKGRQHLASVNAKEPKERELNVVGNNPAPVVPTIVVEDHGDAQKVPPAEPAQEEAAAVVPGAIPAKPAPNIPDWYKVGWRQMSGIDKHPLPEEERDKGVLDLFVSEHYYGDWYHNAGIIIFAVLASHFLTRFNFGWGWLLIVLAVCSTYYNTSVQRVRRNARDDIQRELVKTRLASEHESADWINNFLDRFWPIYEPVLSATVVSSVDQILSTNTPAFLDSLRLSEFTLGNKAPRIDKVRTFPKTEDDVVMMDWGLSFTPNDTSDMTESQKHAKVNPKIVLSIRVGKGLATAALPVLVEDVSFSGLLRIRLKLIANFPHVQVVDICFLEKPVIDYVLKPIGGETFGFDIANMPGLSTFIRDMTHGTLGPMMYDPNVFSLNLEQMLSGKPLDAAIGVVQVVIHSARGIKGTKIGGGVPDPYVSLDINNRGEIARTKYKNNTYNPTWVETKYLLIQSLKDILTLNVYDFNEHRKNTLMSTATFDFSKLLEDSTQEGIVAPLLKDGKERGELRFDVNYYPVIEPEEGKDEILDSTVGIVRLIIHQGKELDQSKSLSGDLNPLARVYLNGSGTSSFSTRCFKHTTSPVWEAPYEFLCTDKESATVTIKVIDDRDFLKDPVIGYMTIKLTDLLDAKGQAGRDWFPLSACKTGKVRVSAEWKPLSMAGSLHGSEQYAPPIGVVKLLLDKAVDVKNVEATLGGKSDPYIRVQVQNVTKGRTEVINNDLNPVWDQIIYVPVHNLKETLLLECMDYQNLTKDRSLGSVELEVADLAAESQEDEKYPYLSKGVKVTAEPIRLDKGNAHKGTLYYTAEFIPSLNVRWNKFESQTTEAKRLRGAQHDEDGGFVGTDGDSSSDEDDVPAGVTIQSEKKPAIVSKSVDNMSVESSTKGNGINGSTGKEAPPGTPGTPVKNGDSKKPPSVKGVVMTNEELLAQQSGIIVFHVISGTLVKKARVEVLLDDGYWPCFSTVKARSTHAQWGYVGEGFMKEVDFGRVWLRLNEAHEGESDDIIAEWQGDAKAFLQATLTGPQTYTLKTEDGRNTSTVTVEARYIPVPVRLEPRETVNNQGLLRVELIDGHDLVAADRGGKSDPYAVFSLNGQKVFKSQTKKKTLNPEWNEVFEVSVPSRVRADFSVEVFDWNQIEQAKSLGIGKIDVVSLEPFEAREVFVHLVSPKHGEKGRIRLRFVFQPAIIAKSRKNTSTFTSAGRAMTQLGGLPGNAGRGVLHGVAGGVAGIAGVFKRGGDKDADDAHGHGVPHDLPAGQFSHPVDASGTMQGETASFPSLEAHDHANNEPGTLRVTVLDAKDLSPQDAKPYATVRLGEREFKTKHTGKTSAPEWQETFLFAASPLTPKLHVWIHDHKTLGKDKEIGEGDVDIWRHIKPEGISSAEVFVELRQGGLLRLRLEFDAGASPNIASSGASIRSERLSTSIKGPSRFSLRGRRANDNTDEST